MERQLAALGIDFEFFEAVDGRKNHPLFARYDDSKRRFYRRIRLSGGELGAFASHFLLWKRCLELGKPIAVLEDDLQLEPFFLDALSKAASHLDECTFVRLWGTKNHVKFITHITLDSYTIVKYQKGPSGALCYIISPEAARKLVAHAEMWYLAVDDYMDRFFIHGVPIYALRPFAVKLTDQESTIERASKVNKSISDRLCREFGRLLEIVRRLKYNALN